MQTNAFSLVSDHGRRCFVRVISWLSDLARPTPVISSFEDFERDQRRLNLEARQKAMFEQMMKDGTHLFAGKKYRPTFGPEFDQQTIPAFLIKGDSNA